MSKRKSIMLLLTYNCNLRCSYCYEPKIFNYKMTLSNAKKFILREINALDESYTSVEIQFMGGEPLLEFPMMRELSEWIWRQEFKQELLVLFAPTNGTLLDSEMKEWFTKNKERIHLGLSFDGNLDMQDRNRSGSSTKVDLDFFIKTWPNQTVKMTISPYTVGMLAKGVKYLHNLGVRYISADLAMGKEIQWSRDSLLQYKKQLKELSDFYIANQQYIPFSMLQMDVTSVKSFESGLDYKTCACGEDLVCIDWTGKKYACHLFSPVALSINDALVGQAIDFTNHEVFISAQCNRCVLRRLCNQCYGMNFICNGKVNAPSAFHCSAFKIRFAENCKFSIKKALQNGDLDQIKKIERVVEQINIA